MPIYSSESFDIISRSPEQTRRIIDALTQGYTMRMPQQFFGVTAILFEKKRALENAGPA